jgi:hypothetical protein
VPGLSKRVGAQEGQRDARGRSGLRERRALESRVDFTQRIATALTPLAFFAIVMNIALRSLVDGDTEVSVDTGLRAAEKLQSVIDKREKSDHIDAMRLQGSQILDAVKTVVPQEMWGAIVEKLDPVERPTLGVDDETDYDEDVFDPGDCDDMDDAM